MLASPFDQQIDNNAWRKSPPARTEKRCSALVGQNAPRFVSKVYEKRVGQLRRIHSAWIVWKPSDTDFSNISKAEWNCSIADTPCSCWNCRYESCDVGDRDYPRTVEWGVPLPTQPRERNAHAYIRKGPCSKLGVVEDVRSSHRPWHLLG